jgi:hypothetical protein
VSLSDYCTETVDVERKQTAAASPANLGGHVVTYTLAYEDLKVSRPQQPSGATRAEAMRRQLEVSHTFYTATPVTVLTGDRVVYGTDEYLVQWSEDEGGQGRAYSFHTLKIG